MRHAAYYSQYKEDSAFGQLELQKKAGSQQSKSRHCFICEERGEGRSIASFQEQRSSPVDESQTCCLASVGKDQTGNVLQWSGEKMSTGMDR